jgi:hypothetical protein
MNEPLPFRDLSMFDHERIEQDMEDASKEMLAFYNIKILGMEMMFDDDD